MDGKKKIRTLHIEDSDADAKLVKLALQDSLFNAVELTRVARLKDALDYLGENNVDIVIADLNLPDSRGLDTVSQLKAFAPNNALIVVTGSDDESTGLLAVQQGAQDYLIKDELSTSTVSRTIRYSLERFKYDQSIVELANNDLLTELPNRNRFHSHLEHALANTYRLGAKLALLFIDFDHFKLINDTYGHQVGDEFLIAVSREIKAAIRSSDFVARLGGDEFVVTIYMGQENTQGPLVVARKILAVMEAGIALSIGKRVSAECSIGVTTYDGQSKPPSPDHFIHEADTAMYLSKERGGNCVSYLDEELEQKANRRLEMLKDLGSAINNHEFYLVYQPIFEPKDNSFIGIEGLLRWKNKKNEIIPPNDFIPVVEETGLINSIGLWIIQQATKDYCFLMENLGLTEKFWVSINLSPIQLLEVNWLEQLTGCLEGIPIRPEKIHFEITETQLLKNIEDTENKIKKAKEIGFQFAIDDFGVGYSSMSHLKDLSVDILKIDRSFISKMHLDERSCAIVKAMISLGHILGMKIVAEGVENQIELDILNELNCDYIQGYLIARPMPMDKLTDFLSGKLKSAENQSTA